MLRNIIAAATATKVVGAVAIAAAAGGGVALAASTAAGSPAGSGFERAAATASMGASTDASTDSSTDTAASSSAASSSAAGSGSSSSEAGAPSSPAKTDHPGSATPSPSLKGLCTAFQAGATSNRGKAIDNPAFTALVTAAGGKDNLAAFCITLVGPPRTTHSPKAPASPVTTPSHPVGRPSSVPPARH